MTAINRMLAMIATVGCLGFAGAALASNTVPLQSGQTVHGTAPQQAPERPIDCKKFPDHPSCKK
jgi:hypothetical protein